MNQKIFRSIGIMSGSSLDGLDVVYSIITSNSDSYTYKIINAKTYSFPKDILIKLKNVRSFSSQELHSFDIEFGILIGNIVNLFISTFKIEDSIDFISSHGHTVFHYPSQGYTLQIGNGFHINHITSIPTINNLRMADVAHGGQGTPIVPIGDLLLFKEFKYCLNLGGIMNISIKNNDTIFSYDIGICNQILNHYSIQKGMEYDKDGLIAATGKLNTDLYDKLNLHPYFHLSYPKSLDNSFSTDCLQPIIDSFNVSIEDILNTFCHHIAFQIKSNLENDEQVLITGGGANNKFLLDIFSQYNINYFLPSEEIIDYKEALIMSLIGVRYMENKYNVLKSVTGASKNTINGQLFSNQ